MILFFLRKLGWINCNTGHHFWDKGYCWRKAGLPFDVIVYTCKKCGAVYQRHKERPE